MALVMKCNTVFYPRHVSWGWNQELMSFFHIKIIALSMGDIIKHSECELIQVFLQSKLFQ